MRLEENKESQNCFFFNYFQSEKVLFLFFLFVLKIMFSNFFNNNQRRIFQKINFF